MDLNYYYVVLFLFKAAMAENLVQSRDNNTMDGNFNNKKLKPRYNTRPDLSPSKIYYFGAKTNPNFNTNYPDFSNGDLNDEAEDRQAHQDNQELNIYNNNVSDESSRNGNLNEFTTPEEHRSDQETLMERSASPSEIEAVYIQRTYPGLIVKNITKYENTIDIRTGEDQTMYANNYGYNVHTEAQPPPVLDNFYTKFREDNNQQEPLLTKGAMTTQFAPPQMIVMGLPQFHTTLNTLPIRSTNVQPKMLTNILFKNIPSHQHHHHRQDYLHHHKLTDSVHPNYYINNLPRKKIIFNLI